MEDEELFRYFLRSRSINHWTRDADKSLYYWYYYDLGHMLVQVTLI